jgi:hypothetical protein
VWVYKKKQMAIPCEWRKLCCRLIEHNPGLFNGGLQLSAHFCCHGRYVWLTDFLKLRYRKKLYYLIFYLLFFYLLAHVPLLAFLDVSKFGTSFGSFHAVELFSLSR